MRILEKIRSIGHYEDRFDTKTTRHHLSGARRRGGHGRRHRAALRARRGGGAWRLQHHHPLRPAGRRGPPGDPGAAGDRRRPSSPDPQGPAHLGRPGGRNRRAARNPPLRPAGRLRRRGDQPLSRLRDPAGAAQAEGEFPPEVDADEVVKRYIKSIGKGLLKVMSKMGISTYQSYCGAQIFDAVGLRASSSTHISSAPPPRSRASASTRSPKRPCAAIASPSATRRSIAMRSMSAANTPTASAARTMPGRRRTWSLLQHAVRGNARDKFKALYLPSWSTTRAQRFSTIRGLFHVKMAEELGHQAVPLEEVESRPPIVRRFATGAMSLRLDQPARPTPRWRSP